MTNRDDSWKVGGFCSLLNWEGSFSPSHLKLIRKRMLFTHVYKTRSTFQSGVCSGIKNRLLAAPLKKKTLILNFASMICYVTKLCHFLFWWSTVGRNPAPGSINPMKTAILFHTYWLAGVVSVNSMTEYSLHETKLVNIVESIQMILVLVDDWHM